MKVILRILAYLVLALSCYGLAFIIEAKLAIGLFIVCGIIFELHFWREILFGFSRETNQ